ncbi:hypothetical protein LGT39_03395 [Demequina sp. TTPB684]|uniref:hypothetical protein n=1 Tax=unclassified Demequina TaxID=2620311 RepID=UPI001CF5236D|nr:MULTISPECIES: hypothetical protein [unclassified Demequina]MCB2411892.1 hypothetical protein [Demequina sp. TTPB684]UPU87368.1 hypothetical protein LGT36_008785 [Demequina sp. TMPB413]
MTELAELPDLDQADARDLVGRAVLDGLRLDGANLDGTSAAQVRLLECALVDCRADALDLPGVTAVDVYVGGLQAQTLSCRNGEWRDATWAEVRIGAVSADGCEFTDFTVRDSRIDLLSLRDTRIRRLTVRHCRIDTLDLSMATVEDLTVLGGTVGEVLTEESRMTRVDLSNTTLGAVGHPGSLRGMMLSRPQIEDIAPALAAHLGIAAKDVG